MFRVRFQSVDVPSLFWLREKLLWIYIEFASALQASRGIVPTFSDGLKGYQNKIGQNNNNNKNNLVKNEDLC